MEPDKYISDRETLERLVRLETKVHMKFESLEQALMLARQTVKSDRDERKIELDRRLEGMNQFQKRMDKLEGTFATRSELAAVSKLLYIGLGIVAAFQFFMQYLWVK